MANKAVIPDVLPTSPTSLSCPFCGAKPGNDCATSSGGFAVLHLARVKAAAQQDARNKSTSEDVNLAAPGIAGKRQKRTG